MDSLESLDFSSFIIFSDDPWSLLVSFCQLFKLPLVVQCCDVICEWPLIPQGLREGYKQTALLKIFSISNHKANTTELHPKVRKTCPFQYLMCIIILVASSSVNNSSLLFPSSLCRKYIQRSFSLFNVQGEWMVVKLCHEAYK